MHAHRSSRSIVAVAVAAGLAAVLAACSGGSGSSGFDITAALENQQIGTALDERSCVAGAALTICASGALLPAPMDQPSAGNETVELDAGFPADVVTCAPAGAGTCTVEVHFSAAGFAAGTRYRLAWRGVEPTTAWTIGDEPESSGAGSFAATAALPVAVVRAQLAVLAFLPPGGGVAGVVQTLGESGADLAFVSPELGVE